MSKLTGKQRLFIEAYLQCFNGVEAARRAGYQGSYSTLGVTAHDNLKNPKVKSVIDARLKDFQLTTDQALALLAAHASFDPGPYLKIEKGQASLDIEALRDAGLTGVIKSITPMRDGNVKYEFESRQGAIDKILRAQGAYQDKVDVTSGGKELAAFTDERRALLTNQILERAGQESSGRDSNE